MPIFRRQARRISSSALVFLGGSLDPDNGASHWFAITREGAALNLDQIRDVAHCVEPAVDQRRFDTRFFRARAPDHQMTIFDG